MEEPDRTPKKKRKPKRSDFEWVEVFLRTLRISANVKLSADTAGVSRSVVYDHKEADQQFAKDWKEAIDDAMDGVEGRLMTMALDGCVAAAIFLLKTRRPEIYADKPPVTNINIGAPTAEEMTDEQLAEIARRSATGGKRTPPKA